MHALTQPEAEVTASSLTCPTPDDGPSNADFEPVQVAYRSDGWTPEKQRAFIEELADCGIVREAAGRVGMTEQSAYRLRRRADATTFNLAWDTAVRVGTERLRSIAYERAVNGTVRPRWFKGQQVGEERMFDNRLLIYLLGKAQNREGDKAAQRASNWDDWMNAVEDRLAGPMPGPDQIETAPVWQNQSGEWLTSFAPPAGFEGRQEGRYGELDYCRATTEAERTAIHSWLQRTQDDGHRRRDSYFHRLAEVSSPR